MKIKLKSVKSRLLVYFLPLITISILILFICSFYVCKNALIKSNLKVMTQVGKLASDKVNEKLMSNLKDISKIAKENLELADSNVSMDKKNEFLVKLAKVENFTIIKLADKNGDIYLKNGEHINIKDRAYFNEAIKGKDYISNPVISKEDKELIVVYSVPLKDASGNIVGVLAANKPIKGLSDITNSIEFLKTGESYMLDREGVTIASKDSEDVKNRENVSKNKVNDPKFKKIVEIEDNMKQGKSGIDEYDWKGTNMYISYQPIKIADWSLGVEVEKDDLLKDLNNLKITLSIISLITILAAIIVVLFVSKRLTKGLVKVEEHMQFIGRGDFTHKVENKFIKSEDEIGSIFKTIKATEDSIGEMIKVVKNSVQTTDENSTNLASISEELSALTSNISSAIEEVAKGTSKQSSDLTGVVEKLELFGDKINNVSENINLINNLSLGVLDNSKRSNNDMDLLIRSIKEFNDRFKDFSINMQSMNDDIKKVNEITDLINSIAEQTNLLALNAAIEAARAGESGKGFTVVAEEIRKLAEQSKESSQNIYSIIGNLLKNTKIIVDGTETMGNEIEKQKGTIEDTINSFNHISSSVEVVTPKINEITVAFEDITKDKENILSTLEDMSSISEEISASAEEISASADELNSSSIDVAKSAQRLSEGTVDMTEEIKKFKL